LDIHYHKKIHKKTKKNKKEYLTITCDNFDILNTSLELLVLSFSDTVIKNNQRKSFLFEFVSNWDSLKNKKQNFWENRKEPGI